MNETMSQKSNTAELKLIILQVVASIPFGQIASYGQIARLSGCPSHARFVGAVLKKLPSKTSIPWHRVINSKGGISFPVDNESFIEQKSRLLQEGVEVKNGKISLSSFGWSA